MDFDRITAAPRTRPTRGGVVVDEAQTICHGADLALTLWPSPASLQLSNVMIMLEEYGRFWKDALTVKLPSAQF